MNTASSTKNSTAATPAEVKPNTGQGAERSPAAVGAGPGNQVQDNTTRPSREDFTEEELRPGALPDGTVSVPREFPGFEGMREKEVEAAAGSSGVE